MLFMLLAETDLIGGLFQALHYRRDYEGFEITWAGGKASANMRMLHVLVGNQSMEGVLLCNAYITRIK
jgi:hypothetical protein